MDTGSVIFGIDIQNPFSYSCFHAGVVKLVDARDSKSREPQAHVGSIPTSGTKISIMLCVPHLGRPLNPPYSRL